jgi:tRNA 2-thiouridine synthesizing protein D
MDAPYENARSTTALRLIDIAARRGYDVNVFAYEGAVGLPFTKQAPHPNAVHGRDADEEDHPLPHQWIQAIADAAKSAGGKLEWINCGLCVDERGVAEALPFVTRGTPGHLWSWSEASDNTLIIATK